MPAPKLRFKEFNDEWNYKLFNDIFEFIQNNSFSRDMLNYSENSKIYNIHYGDILTKYGEIIDFNIISNIVPKINNDISLSKFENKSYLKNGDIIIADTAEDLTVGKSCEVVNLHCKALAGLHTIPCRPKFKFASQYLGEYINSTSYHSQLIPYITGIKVSSISKNNIIKTKIYFPTIKEQEKISELFSLLNKKIELQQRKIEVLKMYKKGLESKVFDTLSKSTNNKIITEIADTFIGLVTTMTEHYVENGVRLIRNSDIKENQFIFNDNIFLDENFANKNCNRKHIIGDIVTVHTGDVGTSAIIDEKLNGSIGFATIVTRVKNNEIANNKYICWYYNSSIYKNIIKNIITGDGRNNLNMKDFNKIKIPLPSIEQQEKISNLFENIKSKIVSCEKEYKVLIKYKKYLLQQMFI